MATGGQQAGGETDGAPTRRRDRSGLSAPAAAGLLGLMAAVVVAYVATAPVTRASANVAGAVEVASSSEAPTTSTTAAPPEPPPSTTTPPTVSTTVPPTTVPATTAAPTPARPVVAVVGDSLAFSAALQLDPAWQAAGFTPRSEIAPGRQIPVIGLDGQVSSGLDAIRSLKEAGQPALWVVQLGTNDIFFEPFDGDRYAELVTSVLDAIGPEVPVVWVDVWRGDRPAQSQLFDAVLEVIATQRPQLHLADWVHVAQTEPVLRPDGVHLNPFGVERFTRTLVDAAIVVHATSAAG